MVDGQGSDPAKRVVKRVVKKTVVRPSASSPAPADPAPKPTVRYGRPVATASRPSQGAATPATRTTAKAKVCLLYTSDAADEVR
ncbi:hypothetical protein AERO_12775, partial [Aeromicrobium fastidiosum]|uniref:hypothetical protein n=1 Tax=Aeromicrobium fastidiosum TaxID=52699 RepID=UPI0020233C95